MMVLFWLGCVAFGFVLEFSTQCPCKRETVWFGPRHPRAVMMLVLCLAVTASVIGAVFNDSVIGLIFSALLASFHWIRWWKHESGKWKRRAAKAAGYVTFNRHGRLVIEQ